MKLSRFSFEMVVLISACGLLLHVTRNAMVASEMSNKGSRTRYCGQFLVEIMRLVCNGNYYSHRKRGDPELEADYREGLEPVYSGMPFFERYAAALAPLSKRSVFLRPTRGIIDECCNKPCNYRVLSRYCAVRTTQRPEHISTTSRSIEPALSDY